MVESAFCNGWLFICSTSAGFIVQFKYWSKICKYITTVCVPVIVETNWRFSREANILLTHWGRDKMEAISQTTHSNTFSWMTMLKFRLEFHWNLFLRVQFTIFQHWFRLWLGADQATSHYLNQWWFDYWLIYVSLGLNDLIHFPLVPQMWVSKLDQHQFR